MFDKFYSTIISVAIIVMIGLGIVAMIRSKNGKPYLMFVFGLVWFFVGLFNVFTGVNYYTTYSKVYGTLEQHDPYEDFNYFEYDLKDIAWYVDNNNYYYQTSYATSMEFDGTENEYTLLLNNKPCETSSTFGKLRGVQQIYFNDVDGTYKNTIGLDVNITFYASSISLKINTDATHESINLLNEYIKVNGFKLRIIDKVYSSFPLLSDSAG